MKQNILQKAKAVKTSVLSSISNEDKIDLAMAYLKKEVTLTQVSKAVWPGRNVGSTMIYGLLMAGIKEAILCGKIKLL